MKNFYTVYFQIGRRLKSVNHLAALLMLVLISLQAQAQVGVGTTTPDGSAQLDVSSTNKGILIPRMNQAGRDAILTPATGLLIFQTNETPGFYYYNGSAWITINGSATGNPGQAITNGTAGGQVYLTAPTSPYQPQAPQTVTGDVTINAQGATSISPGAITTSKLASGAVTLDKLAATGTANEATYLRGDNTWAKPQELISTSFFNGRIGSSFPQSSSYKFAGPTTTITLTTSKQITASAVAVLGILENNFTAYTEVPIDICFQLVSGGNITSFNGSNSLVQHVTNETRTFSATGSIILQAGTYRIGLGIKNPYNYSIRNNENVNGWVMVY